MHEAPRGRRVLLCVGGGIAAYKTPELVRALIAAGCSVQVTMTEAAEAFVAELSLRPCRPARSARACSTRVAEELDVPFEHVTMLLGDTARAPNQGPTIASASLQIHAAPLRQAAATARAWLLARAAERLRVNLATLQVGDGVVSSHDGADSTAVGRIGYGELVAGEHVELTLDPKSSLKSPTEWRIAGQPLPRVDIPGKVTGEAVFVHDVRMPGMLHGRVLRPPYAGADHGDFIGRTLRAVTKEKIDVFLFELLVYRELVNARAMPVADAEGEKLPDYFTAADDITPREHVDIQAAAKRWVDSSISKTANVPTDYKYGDFKDIYLYAHEKDLKGCTTFRFNPEAFQGVLVKEKDLKNTTYVFTLDDGSEVEARGDEEIEYDGETHTAANLFDALKEGYYGKV